MPEPVNKVAPIIFIRQIKFHDLSFLLINKTNNS